MNHTDIQRYGAIILWLGMMLYGQYADYAMMPGPKGVSGAGDMGVKMNVVETNE